jgi:hypothetical protein
MVTEVMQLDMTSAWKDGLLVISERTGRHLCSGIRRIGCQAARRSGGQAVRRSGGQAAKRPGGRAVRWPGGQAARILIRKFRLIVWANWSSIAGVWGVGTIRYNELFALKTFSVY